MGIQGSGERFLQLIDEKGLPFIEFQFSVYLIGGILHRIGTKRSSHCFPGEKVPSVNFAWSRLYLVVDSDNVHMCFLSIHIPFLDAGFR